MASKAKSARIPPEIAIIFSSVEDGLSCLTRPEPDPEGGRDLPRVIALAAGSATDRERGGLSRWRRKRAIGLMARLDNDAPTVSELAAACRLSSGYFIKAFKRTFGVTPRRWRQRLRIEQAKSLLVSNNLSIAEIALVCGFADQSHLTRVFGQIVGVPPARWRRRCVDDVAIAYSASQR